MRFDPQSSLKWKDTPIWLRVVLIVAITNFASFIVIALLLGGDALNGKEAGGRYFLMSHGRYTEVSKAMFDYSLIHTSSVLVTHSVAVFAFIWYYLRRRQRWIRPVSLTVPSSAPISEPDHHPNTEKS
jgi:hypothetical protein